MGNIFKVCSERLFRQKWENDKLISESCADYEMGRYTTLLSSFCCAAEATLHFIHQQNIVHNGNNNFWKYSAGQITGRKKRINISVWWFSLSELFWCKIIELKHWLFLSFHVLPQYFHQFLFVTKYLLIFISWDADFIGSQQLLVIPSQ